ncbi:UDP-glucose 4-epimerase GalE [Magnetospirillum sp. ME-1]|uniref:UDP-glucose 4-epimerase GalE n=1 Tax=Magnetospirillum sp. ME-1 TaxID=1639348 RepID=UPI000A17C273|nr:UDP-glucose 4-epimerase GalE [Magnetospirillum sp. ME-1]ARJ66536.1 UDP-glucose 4-epimerase GalE [Magnetospirillum sp. ME-1]
MTLSPVLVTGGAGYIGSHVVLALVDAGWPVVVVDNLSTGRRDSVPDGVPLVEGDAGDGDLVRSVLKEHGCVAVLHFAGSIVVPESVTDPLKYYHNNTVVSRSLIESCLAAGVHTLIFSSTAAVYGMPASLPATEDMTPAPINPYGTSKLMTEWMLRDVAAATPLRYAALRYFNVAGADPRGRTGQCTPEATHLIKVACEAALGRRPGMALFGDDYPTIDGTCVRDYIHVSDLADAHVAALRYLLAERSNLVANVGYGRGFSVRQVISAVEKAAQCTLPVTVAPRRAGDSAELVADSSRLRHTLGWTPRLDDLDTIVATALAWERRLLAAAKG